MSPLRQLCVIYLIVAGAFSASILLARHPHLARMARSAAVTFRDDSVIAAVAMNKYAFTPAGKFAGKEFAALGDAISNALHPQPVQIAAQPAPQMPEPLTIAAEVHPQQNIASAEPNVTLNLEPPQSGFAPEGSPHVLQLPPQAGEPPAPPKSAGPSTTAEIDRVQERLKDSLTSEMFDHFDLFLYVSKADKGPWAQHMFVFQKTGKTLALLYDWPVSTGREKVEYNEGGDRLPSFTPRGYYELDPHRFYVHYTSMQWGEKMPYAMFFNWEKDGMPSGLAIHGAVGGDIGLLGERASAGCIRLAPENAARLQSLIRSKYEGLVPEFAYDKKTATISNDGLMLHDRDGRLELAKGYKVLVFIENYGGENVVAALF
jgi:hypothetical protein